MSSQSRSSAVLWGHLLRHGDSAKVPSSSSSASSLPYVAPLDKAGTTMRILLNDTQANLESFSERVCKLAGSIDETKQEMMTVKKLFEQDHEKLTEDMVDLVNRCQAEVQRSMGCPAQAVKISELRADLLSVDRKVETLDKKIDMLHVLNQTQSQTLQTLQDQQGKILAAIIPILPLLQAVPLHIESARNYIKDVVNDTKGFSCAPDSLFRSPPKATSQINRLHASRNQETLEDIPSHKKRRLENDGLECDPHSASPCLPCQSSDDILGVPANHPPQHSSSALADSHLDSRADLALTCHATSLLPDHTPHDAPRSSPVHRSPPPALENIYSALYPGISQSNDLHADLECLYTAPVSSQSNLVHGSRDKPRAKSTHSNSNIMPLLSPYTVKAMPSNSYSDCGGVPSSSATDSVCGRHPEVMNPLDFTPRSTKAALPLQSDQPILLDVLMATSSLTANLVGPATSGGTGKTMSLKDRRAMLAEPRFRIEGKRFIPFDDDDEGEFTVE